MSRSPAYAPRVLRVPCHRAVRQHVCRRPVHATRRQSGATRAAAGRARGADQPVPAARVRRLQPRQRASALVAARARRVPRAHRRLREPRLHRRPRRLYCAEPRPSQRRRRRRSRGSASRRNLQDARVGDKKVGPTARAVPGAVRRPHGVRRRRHRASRRWPCALGRQELAFGEQRLLGHLAWVNTGRVWDAARATLRSKPFQVDVFAASLVRFLPDDVRQERHRQPPRRRLRHDGEARSRRPSSSRTSFFRRDVNLAQRARAARHAAADHHRRAHRRQAAGAARLRRRDGGAARQPGRRRRERVGRPLADPRVAARQGRREAHLRIQLRHRRRATPPTASAAPSISSIRPATTSWG